MRINPTLPCCFFFRITNNSSPFKDFPHLDVLSLGSKSNFGQIQIDRDIKGFHLYCSVCTESLLKRSNFCGTKKCIFVTVVMWAGPAEVGKESLIEQTNE